MANALLFLGTGGSMGTPVIGCDCPVCHSTNSKNMRMRPCALLTWSGKKILIDMGTDFRSAAIQFGVTELDGVILTHAHQDHVGGIDDLRPLFFKRKEPLPCLLLHATYEEISQRYGYMIHPKKDAQTLLPRFDFQKLGSGPSTTTFLEIPVSTFTYLQVGMEVLGFRVENFAYVTDIREYDEEILRSLRGVETLVVSALRRTPSPMHFTFDEAVTFAQEVGAKQVWFTHIAHELEHEEANASLPKHIQCAYDGLEIAL